MWIVAIAWMFVVVLMSVAEAVNPDGTIIGAIFTFLFYGVGPLALVMYLLGTPMRRKAQRAAEAAEAAQALAASSEASPPAGINPNTSSLPAGDTIASEGKEPGRL